MPAGAVTAASGGIAAPGWYGKLSVLGDFAHRRLAPGVVQHLDAWLSGWIVDSRAQLGDRWLDAYLSAPLLRFAWTPGVVGPLWWFGVLMPSCDRTGRYFPLLVADARGAAPSGRIGRAQLDAWFDRIAAAATDTLDDAASVEAFEEALAAASRGRDAPASESASAPASAPVSAPADADAADARADADAARAAPDRTAGDAAPDRPRRWADALGDASPAAGASCWWVRGADGVDGRPTVLTGLPEAADLTRLLLARPSPDAAAA